MTQAVNHSTYQILRRQLRPLSIKLRISDGIALASHTLWMALTGSAIVAATGWIVPIPHLAWWALAPIALWLLAIAGFIAFRPLPPRRAAQRVDRILDLRERLSTAIELYETGADTPLAPYQQADASALALQLRPRQIPIVISPAFAAGVATGVGDDRATSVA